MVNRKKNGVWRTFLLALAYVATGLLAVQLEVSPVYATPIFPAAGIAIVAMLHWRLAALPGIIIGAFIFDIVLSLQRGDEAGWLSIFLLALVTIVGVSLQAWFGAMLLRRWVTPGIESGNDALRFLLLVPIICLMSACISALGRYWLLEMQGSDLLMSGLMWWMGDSFGVLLGVPLMGIFFGQPRALWRRRRWLVGLPLCLACTLFMVVYIKTSQWEAQRQSEQFRFKSQQFGDMLQIQFGEHERFLASMANVINDPAPILTADNFHNMAIVYLRSRPELLSMVWAPRVTHNERTVFEQWARTAIEHDFAMRQFGAGNVLEMAAIMPHYYPITYIEPLAGNERVRGLDLLSDAVLAATVRRTLNNFRPAASEPLVLMQEAGSKPRSLLLG
jgi:CHASE domain/MASE1